MGFHYEIIDHVQLAAPKGGEMKARAFYGDVLGFEEVEKPDTLKKRGGVWFQAGSIHMHIGIDDPFVPAKKAHPAIRVKNIAAMKRFLQEQQIDFREDNDLPQADRFYIDDPFGNRLEFLEWKT